MEERFNIFHTCIPSGKTFSMVSQSFVKVSVRYQGHI